MFDLAHCKSLALRDEKGLLLALGVEEGGLAALIASDFVRRRELHVSEAAGLENAGQGIVILRRDGVVLVIVTAGAGNGQSEEPARQRIDAVVEFVGQGAGCIGVLVVLRSQTEEAQSGAVAGFAAGSAAGSVAGAGTGASAR